MNGKVGLTDWTKNQKTTEDDLAGEEQYAEERMLLLYEGDRQNASTNYYLL